MSTILVIEDNSANLKLIAMVLETAGHTVLQAICAADGIAIGRDALPDLILLDIQLPGMDGLQATSILKADPATARIPVVALTACAMIGDAARIRAAGCNDYIAKPFEYRDLLNVVERMLHRPERLDATKGD